MRISERFWFGIQPFNGTVYPLPTIYFQRYFIWSGINFVWLWFRAELLVKNGKWPDSPDATDRPPTLDEIAREIVDIVTKYYGSDRTETEQAKGQE